MLDMILPFVIARPQDYRPRRIAGLVDQLAPSNSNYFGHPIMPNLIFGIVGLVHFGFVSSMS